MCGIGGIVDFENSVHRHLLARMSSHLKKRGPDNLGIYTSSNIGLVHTRLSIIDLCSSANQPLFNEDKSLILVCNGEIYNYRSIRESLLCKGHSFSSESDSEILLHLYEEKGLSMLSDLNGMFAFAIWDINKEELFIARDRFGQKPLFYANCASANKKHFAFASGPACLCELNWVDKSVNVSAFHDYIDYSYVPSPKSIYNGIKKLPPGHFAFYNRAGHLKIVKYWDTTFKKKFVGTYKDAVCLLRTKFSDAVKKRLVSDVPLGLFLSGGMDSSIICSSAVKEIASSTKTFSIGFSEAEYDERDYSSNVAKYLGTDHYFKELDSSSFDFLLKLIPSYEEPFADASMLPTALLSQFTREYVSVALSGDGADELFGGYYRYRVMYLFQIINRIPKTLRKYALSTLNSILPYTGEERSTIGKLRRLLKIADFDGVERYLKIISRTSESQRRFIYTDSLCDELSDYRSLEFLESKLVTKDLSYIDSFMNLDVKTYLPEDILVKVDRASMNYALEVRSPFLDHELAQFAMSLPYAWKQGFTGRKLILKDAFAADIPSEIFKRRKKGFAVPIAKWLRNEWRENAMDIVLNGLAISKGLLKKESLEIIFKEHTQSKADHSCLLFSVLVFEVWLNSVTLPNTQFAKK